MQCRSKQASRYYVKARPLIKLDKSNIFHLQVNCLTVLQHTMSLLTKFHTLITLNEKLYFLRSNLHLFFKNVYAWSLVFINLVYTIKKKKKTLQTLHSIFLCKSLYKIITSACILRNSTDSRPTIFNWSP